MNAQSLKMKSQKAKSRAHFLLFAENTPFKPKKVSLKTRYKRNPKFANRDDQWN